jgi:hypothetical protein
MIKKIICFSLLLVFNVSHAQKAPEKKSSELIVSCSGEFIEPRSIVIWWIESDHRFPTRVQDGFRNAVYLGQVTSNAFTWDREINLARLDRYTGLLSIIPKDGSEQFSIPCKKIEKKF